MRYEEPSSMVRWDSPLFTIPWDEAAPLEDIWVAVTKGYIKPATSAVNVVSTLRLSLLTEGIKTASGDTADTHDHHLDNHHRLACAPYRCSRRYHLPDPEPAGRQGTRPAPPARAPADARRAPAPQARV